MIRQTHIEKKEIILVRKVEEIRYNVFFPEASCVSTTERHINFASENLLSSLIKMFFVKYLQKDNNSESIQSSLLRVKAA